MPLSRFLQCSRAVAADAVRRESIDGVEHIVITSFTLPDNIVMNGILYPAAEVDASFRTLERTLAPIEHPVDSDGNYVSALDPIAIHNHHAGAFNVNVQREGKRIKVEKYINVAEAMKTDRGKRLLDRVDEIENNSDPRPIHTSVGVFLEVEKLAEPTDEFEGVTVNAEYGMIARNMLFDHDAILLDSIGAAQPGQGVGMAVNAAGEKVEVTAFTLEDEEPTVNADGLSFREIEKQIEQQLTTMMAPNLEGWIYVIDVFEDTAVFENTGTLFEVPYGLSDGAVTVTGLPVPVTREVSYTPRTNNQGDPMKEVIVNALKAAGIDISGMDDDALLMAYNELQASQAGGGDDDDDGDGDGDGDAEGIATTVTNAVNNAIAPLSQRLDGLEARFNETDEAELNKLADFVGNSDKYPGIDADAAKKLGLETLRNMAANSKTSHGLPLSIVPNADGGDDNMSFDMPNSAA